MTMFHTLKKCITTNNIFNVIIIILSVCLLFGISIFQSTMTWRTDTYFHLSRIYDVTTYIKSFHQPLMVDIHAFSNTGQAINGMYPGFSLLPFIILTSFLQPIAQYETIIFLFILLGSILNYFVFQKLHASKIQSLSSVLATFTFINIFYSSSLSLFGAWSVYFLLPLSVLSLKKLAENSSLIYVTSLAFAVSFVLNTHLVSAIILVCILFIYFVFLMIKSSSKSIFLFQIISAALFSIVLSLHTLTSILSFSKTNLSTVQEIPLTSGTLNIESMIHSLTNPTIFGSATPPIFGILLIADILLLSNLKQFNKNAKIIIFFIFVAQLLISPYFPWALLQNTPVSIIQFPTRLVPFILAIMTLVLFTAKKLDKVGFLVPIIFFSLSITFSYQTSNYVAKKAFPNFKDVKTLKENHLDSIPKYRENTKVDNETLSDPVFYSLYSYPEYIPQTKAKNDPEFYSRMNSVNNHEVFVNNKKISNVETAFEANKIKFTFDKTEKGIINLPVWYYPNMNYVIVTDTGKTSVKTNHRHTLEIRNIATKHVTVIINNPKFIKYSYIISIVGWSAGLFSLIIGLFETYGKSKNTIFSHKH